MNLQADAIFSMWSNNSGIALVNAVLSSNGDLANALYTQINPQNDFIYDQNNPIHQAVLLAIQSLIANINNTNGDCSAIMSMADFINLLKDLIQQEMEKLCNDNLTTFISNYGLSLTQEEKDNILNNITVSCGDDDQKEFEEEALKNLGLAGQDYFYDEEFWSNPDLQFDHQELPSWEDFNNAFPRYEDGRYMIGADNVYEFVGGNVWKARKDYTNATNNTCALKVSIALNGTGINIPYTILCIKCRIKAR